MSLLEPVRLSAVESGRKNNLKLLRFLFASGVILSHCYVLLGQLNREPMQRLLHFSNLGEVAVIGFFFLSGYLILKSGLRWTSPEDFVAARCLRIFPALLCTVLLCLFLLGPLTTTLSLREYFAAPLTRHYLLQMLLRANTLHGLPGVFEGHPAFRSINQPLWTLSSEWLMYMAVLLTCLLFRRNQRERLPLSSWLLVALALTFTAQMLPFQRQDTVRWAIVFGLGGLCFLARSRIPLSIPVALVALLIDAALLRVAPHAGKPLFPLAICYAVAVVGFYPGLYLRAFDRLGDYSYGLYIYGWPIQQLCLSLAHGHAVRLFALAYPCTLVVATLSWHLVEERALRWKPRRSAGRKQLPSLQPTPAG